MGGYFGKNEEINPDSLNGIVTVQFIGEPAVDEGGPQKELFFLVHKHMQQLSSLFTGPPTSRRFVHNMIALQREEYLHYGIIYHYIKDHLALQCLQPPLYTTYCMVN